jgi:hypothetical protein
VPHTSDKIGTTVELGGGISKKLKKLGYTLNSGAGGGGAGIRLKVEGISGVALDYDGGTGVIGTKKVTKVCVPGGVWGGAGAGGAGTGAGGAGTGAGARGGVEEFVEVDVVLVVEVDVGGGGGGAVVVLVVVLVEVC